jgi:outer membrane protein assembly factor BamB
MRQLLAITVVGVLIVPLAAQQTADWTQWRGPLRDGTLTGFVEPRTWPEQLTQKWKIEVGLGYATPLLIGDRVYVFCRQSDDEVMLALDATTGRQLWRTPYKATFKMNSAAAGHGPGPKSTPIFANGRLFAIGMTGAVTAFDANTGKIAWQKPGSEPLPLYTSHAFSPLVDHGLVIFHIGGHNKGALTAFDMNNGDVKWSWDGDGPGYGSPMMLEVGGSRQVVTVTQTKVVGVDVATGALLWDRPFLITNHTNAITPVIHGSVVVIAGNTHPTTAFAVMQKNSAWTTETVWENEDVPMRMTTGVVVDGVLFSLSTRNSGQFFGVDVETGKTLWTSPGRQAQNASVLKAGKLLLVLEDSGDLLVLHASRTGFEPIRKYKVADTDTWTQPVVSRDRMYIKDVSSLAMWTLQ